LVTLLGYSESRYTAASSIPEYEWGYRAAIGARQADSWLRQIPVRWERATGFGFMGSAHDVRDRAQADNLEWIVRQEGPSGKILVFASRNHISTAPVKTNSASGEAGHEVAGTYLRRRFGDRLITIGNLVGTDLTQEPVPRESFDGLAGELDTPLFLLDLRTAPARPHAWLTRA
jgi:hypothetical protein